MAFGLLTQLDERMCEYDEKTQWDVFKHFSAVNVQKLGSISNGQVEKRKGKKGNERRTTHSTQSAWYGRMKLETFMLDESLV